MKNPFSTVNLEINKFSYYPKCDTTADPGDEISKSM
jgi:hypothetical protein